MLQLNYRIYLQINITPEKVIIAKMNVVNLQYVVCV